MAKAKKPTLIVAGSCHARFLFKSLLGSAEARERYEIVYCRNFGFRGQDPVDPDHVARCELLLEQVSHHTPPLLWKENLPAQTRLITFPIVWLTSLWPAHIEDSRNKVSPEHQRGPWPYGDSILLRFLDEGMSPEAAVDRYLNEDVPALIGLERFHEINVAKGRQLDAKADLKFISHVWETFRAQELFNTFNHPAPAMLGHMIREVFGILGFSLENTRLPTAAKTGIGNIHVPVHPAVASYFGLEWYDPKALTRCFDEYLTTREYYRRYAAFEPCRNTMGRGADPED